MNMRLGQRRIVFAWLVVVALAGPAHAQPAAADKQQGGHEQKPIDAGYRLAPRAFRRAVERVRPSLVRIETFGGVSAATGSQRGVEIPSQAVTSGVVLSADGMIATSTFHFLRRPPIITVVLSDGSRHVAQFVGRDETRKVAVLKIDGAGDLPVPKFLSPGEVRIGQWAVSAGLGLGGSKPAISSGIVSASGRISGRAVQTDANTSPANYGGPLVDLEGRVIGICVPLHPQASDTAAGAQWYDSGIGFAIPLAGNPDWLQAVKAGRTLQRADLGIQPVPAGEDGRGVRVAQVKAGSAAAGAGVQQGDHITAVDGDEVFDAMHLRILIHRYVAGDEITLRIVRDQQPREIPVTLSHPASQPEPSAPN